MRSVLHTVNQSPHAGNALRDCLRLALPGSCVLLIEDGVYAAVQGGELAPMLDALPEGLELCALESDLQARGLRQLHPRVRPVDDASFVALAVQHHSSMAWY